MSQPGTPSTQPTPPPSTTGASDWNDAVNKARTAGYSWDDIHSYEQTLRSKAQSEGYKPEDINKYFGDGDPAEADKNFAEGVKLNNYNQTPVASGDWLGDFKAGIERSSGGLLIHGQPTDVVDPNNSTFLGRLTANAGETLGDLPAMTVGAVAGARGGPEGAGAGAVALPQFIKDQYADALANGSYKNAEDFLSRQGAILWDTAKVGLVGAATAGASKYTGRVADSLGANSLTKNAAQIGASLTTLTGGLAAVKGQMPSWEDVADNALILLGMKGAGLTAEKVAGPVRDNLIRNWRDTGQSPRDAAIQAKADPTFRQNIVTPQPPDPPAGSSTTKTDAGDFVIPRISKNFDDAVDWVFQHEGGTTTDTGGLTKFGISSKAHPDLDVKNRTVDQAKEIYHSQYWRAIGADNLPENMRLAAFDSAVNQGVGETKLWLKESGGDLQKFMDLRAQEYKKLADNPKYAQYAKSWGKRLSDLGYKGSLSESGGGGEGEPPEKPTAKPEETDPWKIVASHIAEPDKGPSFGDKVKDEAYKAYTDLFNPLHPINKLTRAAVDGGVSLDDANNPEFLHRIAEHHSELSMYAIQKDMIDLGGNKTGPSLNSIIEPFGKGESLNRFWTYAAAKWALEKGEQGKATGIADDPARQVAEQGEAKYGKAFNDLVDWQNKSLGWMKDAGILSQENYTKWVAENKARIPGYRVMEEGKGGPGSSAKGRTAFNPVKEFKGSERPIQNIHQSLMRDAFLRMELAQSNRANAATADLGEKIGVAQMSDRKAVPIKISADELAKQGFDNDGVDATIFRLTRQQIQPNEVPVFRDGKLEPWTFDDPNIARVIKGMDAAPRNVWQKMAAQATRFTRGAIVLNPLFPIRLMTYDVPWQFITKDGYRNTLADVYVGLRDSVGKPEDYDGWMRSGGAERIFDGLSKQQYIRKMLADHGDPAYTEGAWNQIRNGAGNLMAYAKIWGNSVSQLQRFGNFQRNANLPPNERAIASADAAFHRASFGGPQGKSINAVMPFTAAYLNSIDQTVRAQTGHAITGENVGGAARAARTTAKALAVITLPMLANWATSRDKEWYKAAPDWQKDNGLLINVGSDDNLHAVPLFWKFPPLISFLYGGLPRRMMEAFVEDNPHAWDGVWKSLVGSLAPPGGLLTYNVLTPLIEHMANYSFFRGHALVSDDIKRSMLPPQQANPYSTPFAKAASKYVNDLPLLKNFELSPPVIDNYISGWGGTLGTAATKQVMTDPKAPAPHITDMPLISSWLSRYPSANAQPIVDYENRMGHLTQIHGSIAQLFKQHDLNGMATMANENPLAANLHQFHMRGDVPPDNLHDYSDALRSTRAQVNLADLRQLAQADKAIKNLKLFAQQVTLQDAKKMSPTDKQQMLDQTYAVMQVTAERANGILDKMGAP